MITRVLSVSLLAGLLAGLLVAALQHVTTTPLILQAEIYEAASASQPAPASVLFADGARIFLADGGTPHSEMPEWKPNDGFQRTALTGLVTIGASIGFAALLLAGMLASGETITERRVLIWAACGFIAFGLAPAMGLAPGMPGSAAAEIRSRQLWWIMTAVVTAGSLFVFLRMDAPWVRALAALAMLLPHLIGAPQPVAPESKVPAEIAGQFAALSLGVQAALWMITGFAVGVLWPRFSGRSAKR